MIKRAIRGHEKRKYIKCERKKEPFWHKKLKEAFQGQ
jgi:hypothetical protein